MSNKNKISTTLTIFGGRMFVVAMLLTIATVSTAFADNITKTFEIGAGTQQLHSHVRTFNIPCGTPGGIAAVVKFQRLGPSGAGSNIPIIVELREPDTAANQEGPIVETKTVTATKTEQTVTLLSPLSTRGCTLPWRVRVKYANDGTAPVQAFGSIRLDFDGRATHIDVDTPRVLEKGSSITTTFGGSAGFGQGTIEIRMNWDHSLYGANVPGSNPIKLRWELLNPSGTVVRTVEAYSSDEGRSELTKFRLLYQVTKQTSGQWKVRITNVTTDDATNFEELMITGFTPGCP